MQVKARATNMTKKDYIVIATAINNEIGLINYYGGSKETEKIVRIKCELLVISIANTLQKDNNKFNRDRFLKACGITL